MRGKGFIILKVCLVTLMMMVIRIRNQKKENRAKKLLLKSFGSSGLQNGRI